MLKSGAELASGETLFRETALLKITAVRNSINGSEVASWRLLHNLYAHVSA